MSRTKRKDAEPAPTVAPPRVWIAGLSLLLAGLFLTGAHYLPWRAFTIFWGLTALLGLAHLATAGLAVVNHRGWIRVWRLHAFVAIAWMTYLAWVVVSSATHIAGLYGSLGNGLAAGLAAAFAPVVLLSLPTALWAITATGGLRTRPFLIGSSILFAVLILDPLRYYVRGHGEARAAVSSDLGPVLEKRVGGLAASSTTSPTRLEVLGPLDCAAPPSERETAFVFYRDQGPGEARCLQASDVRALEAEIDRFLSAGTRRAPIVVDLVTRTRRLDPHTPLVASFLVRPGLDGVCLGSRCLSAWQLVALDEFNAYTPVDFIQDLRLGVDPARLRRHFGQEGASFIGLTALEIRSHLLQGGEVRSLRRLRSRHPSLDSASVSTSLADARRFLLGAQAEDGRFMYLVNPFTGEVSYQGFSVPRQAGTTLALCEVGDRSPEVNQVVARSLGMLETLLVKRGELGALIYPPGAAAREASLGPAALSLIAFLACRDRVGRKHDETIGRLGRLLLVLMRADGSFRPRFDLEAALPVEGPQVLYAAGQGIFALVLLEALAAKVSHPSFPDLAALTQGVERAMSYISGPYWGMAVRDFFFIEENWNCLAAGAALSVHRHDAYERFCLDYIRFKMRYMFDEGADVDPDFAGAYSFGNVTVPYNTPTAGFAEAAAAALQVAEVRQEDASDIEQAVRGAMSYLLFAQWREEDCFACTTKVHIPGAFSESLSSPIIRIDYVQHALSGMGHGARALGL